MYYSLDDLKEQAEFLYKTNPESNQLLVINNAIRDGSKAIEDMERAVNKSSVTETDVLNNADCLNENCD